MAGLPWWAGLLLAFVAFVLLVRRSARAWRASFRRDFIAYLEREAPELQVAVHGDDELEIRDQDGATGVLNLGRLFDSATQLRAGDRAGRETLFAHWVKMLRERKSAQSLDPDRDRARVMPRIVRDDVLIHLRAAVSAQGKTLPSVPMGIDGLGVVMVLDSEASVAYLNDDMLSELGLSVEEALALARENLSRVMDVAAVVRAVQADKTVSVVKGGDSYDAARLLLVPGCLGDGDELAAAVPDRDTLVLTALPKDGDWSGMRKMARAAAGEVLWPEPLRVTAAGIFPV